MIWGSARRLFDDLDLLFSQPVEFIDEGVDLLIGGFNLALEEGLFVVGLCLRLPLVEVEHPIDEAHHLIVAGDVFGVGELIGLIGIFLRYLKIS